MRYTESKVSSLLGYKCELNLNETGVHRQLASPGRMLNSATIQQEVIMETEV